MASVSLREFEVKSLSSEMRWKTSAAVVLVESEHVCGEGKNLSEEKGLENNLKDRHQYRLKYREQKQNEVKDSFL